MGKVKDGSKASPRPVYRGASIANSDLARIQKEVGERKFEIAVDQVTGMSKWLTASLFAANSGGLLTVLNTADKLSNPEVPGAMFAGGLIFALLSGTALQEIYNQMSEPLSDLIVYWSEVEAGANLNVEAQNEIIGRLNKVRNGAG